MNLDIYPDILVNLEALGLDFSSGLGGFIDAFFGNGDTDAGAEAGADVEATGLSSGSSGFAVDADLEAGADL